MNEVLFNILLGIISIIITILTGIVIPLIKEKIGNEKFSKYEGWAVQAVQAAEMLFKDKGMGKTKKEYVVNFLNEMFNKNRVVIAPEQIEILVESAVKQMKLDEEKK